MDYSNQPDFTITITFRIFYMSKSCVIPCILGGFWRWVITRVVKNGICIHGNVRDWKEQVIRHGGNN